MDKILYGQCVIKLMSLDQQIDRAMRIIDHGPMLVIGLDYMIVEIIHQCWDSQISPEAALERIRPYPLKIADLIETEMLRHMPVQGTH